MNTSPDILPLDLLNSRYARPYGPGSSNVKTFDSGLFDTAHYRAVIERIPLIDGGIELRHVSFEGASKLVVNGDPEAIYKHLFPTISDADWRDIKYNFEAATGEKFTIANFWGYMAVRIDNGKVLRAKDISGTVTDVGIDISQLRATDFLDLGHYYAYTVIPEVSMLNTLLNNNIRSKPSAITGGNVFYFPVASSSTGSSQDLDLLRYIIYQNTRGNGVFTFEHWMADDDAANIALFIATMEGNWRSAPIGYLVGWYTIKGTLASWYVQIHGPGWLWKKIKDTWP